MFVGLWVTTFVLACGGGQTGTECPDMITPPPCGPPPVLTVRVSVSGSVRDDYTTNPIQGASVTANGKTAITGADGRFSLDSITTDLVAGQPAAPFVSIQANGFDTWAQPVPVPGRSGSVNADLFRTGSLVTIGDILVYLPPSNAVIRGVFFNMFNNTNGDSRPIIRFDSMYYDANASLANIMGFRRKMMGFARGHGLAIMGAQITFADTASQAWPRFIDALRTASTISGRPELAEAPIVMHGFGAGGCIAYGIATLYPERTIGFIAEKMAGRCMGDGATAISVPGYLIHGKQTSAAGIEDHFRATFERNRLRGAIWAFGIEQDAGGQLLRNHDILFNWLNDVVAARLPATPIQGAPLSLLRLNENAGWLGDQTAHAIGPWPCFAANKNTASWLPTQRVATDWQGMMSLGSTKTIFSCAVS